MYNEKVLTAAAGGFFNLGVLRQIGLLVGLSASIALGVYLVLWSKEPQFLPLYAALEAKEVSQVIDALGHEKIAYKYDTNGSGVLVPADKVHEARMRLAALGLPKNATVGLEIMDENPGFTGSQFSEFVRYRRGLEGELARTIGSFESIRAARVHLGLAKESVFLKKKSISSASVMVDLYPGRKLSASQVMGIVHVVASSVPGLSQDNVSVIDQSGALLNRGAQENMGSALDQFNYVRQLEQVYAKRVEDLLAPLLGSDRVRAEVTADVDLTAKEETQERYSPEKQVVRSESVLIERKDKKDAAGGVPGALSNQPPVAGKLADDQKINLTNNPAATAVGDADNVKDQATRNFEVDKSVVYLKHNMGKLSRLSVAVLVDDKITYDKSGQEKRTPLSEEELTRITTLVKDAVGYQKDRGDTVSVVNASFAQQPPLSATPKPPIYENPFIWTIVKQVLASILGVLLILKVLRPMVMALATHKPKQAMTLSQSDENLAQVKQISQQDLKRVVQSDTNMKGLDTLKWMEPRAVADLIRSEHPQIQALILSYLAADEAAGVLKCLDENTRLALMMRISTLDTIQPAALQELNDIMERQFSGNTVGKMRAVGGVKTAANIMNAMDAALEEPLLAGIKGRDAVLGQSIQDLMLGGRDAEMMV